jgi:hypothetical protein
MPGTPIPPDVANQQSPGQESQAAAVIVGVAKKTGVPAWALWGIYGNESSYGTAYGPGQPTYGDMGLTGSGLWHPGESFLQSVTTAAGVLKTGYTKTGSWDRALSYYNTGSTTSYNATYVNNAHSNGAGLSAVRINNSYLAAVLTALGVGGAIGIGVAAAGGIAAAAGAEAGEASSAGGAGEAGAGAGAGGAAGSAASKLAGGLGSLKTDLGVAALVTAIMDPKMWTRILLVAGGAVLIILALTYMLKTQLPTPGPKV